MRRKPVKRRMMRRMSTRPIHSSRYVVSIESVKIAKQYILSCYSRLIVFKLCLKLHTRAIFFSRRQRNGGKSLRYHREQKIRLVYLSCLATAKQSSRSKRLIPFPAISPPFLSENKCQYRDALCVQLSCIQAKFLHYNIS